ncbi:MAG TPA: nitroreductase family protein [Dehalococcoidia bacterium]|nr:nitroreductase family protein [Dehalococcoidia bacterium]
MVPGARTSRDAGQDHRGGYKAPSGTNLQPGRFVVITGSGREAIAAAVRNNWDSNEGLRTMVEQGQTAADKTQRLMLRGAKRLFTQLDLAPVFIIPCLYQVASPTNDPNSLLAGSSIYEAVQNLLLATRALGLGAVLTTFQAGIEPELRELLALPDDTKPAALIPLGFPAANFGPTTRRPVEEVLHWERWAG